MKLNLPLIFDTFFVAFSAFLLFFTAVRYYTKSQLIGLILGICAALLFGALAFVYIRKKSHKKLICAADEKDKQLLAIHLSLCPEEQVINIFSSLLGCNIVDNLLESDDTIYFINFKLSPLSPDDIAGAITFKSQKKKIILCNAACKECKEIADNFSIKIATLNELYPQLKASNLLPQKYIFEGAIKPTFFKRLKLKFNRKLTAPLFWCGLSLLFFSFFTFYPAYYIATGGVLIILSAVCLVFGKR
jgi:hypothetical protein